MDAIFGAIRDADEAHAGLAHLGDISQNSPDKQAIKAANKYGYNVIKGINSNL